MNFNGKIAFIGVGFMAGAMIDSLLNSNFADGEHIYAINEAFPELNEKAALEHKITCGTAEDLQNCDVVVFSVKPQIFPEVLEMYGKYLSADKLYISIMAGITLDRLSDISEGARIIRCMPNLALSVGEAATAYALGKYASAEDEYLVREIFGKVGTVKRVNEEMLSAVTALSGSGPAYFCRLCEALENAAIEFGMDAESARELSVQTLIGTAKLLSESGSSPAELRTRVTSKKGTTEAALCAMDDMGFDDSVKAAFESARKRSDELSK